MKSTRAQRVLQFANSFAELFPLARFLLGMTVVPVIGVYLIVTGNVALRAVGVGLLLYGLLLCAVLPIMCVVVAPPKWAARGGIARLSAALFCLALPIPIMLYLNWALIKFDAIVLVFTVVPVWTLSAVLLFSWFRAFFNNHRVD